MPYVDIADFPMAVRCHLPEHAQQIYLSAFNHVSESHELDPDREGITHRIAWAAVKRRYCKVGAEWVRVDEFGL